MPFRIFVLISMLFFPYQVLAEEKNADEEAVWKMEEAYWAYVKNNDIEGFESLWDERIIGWGTGEKNPFQGFPEGARSWIQSIHSDPTRVFKYELTREFVQGFGDVVVTQYRAREYFVLADTAEIADDEFNKITHTWQRRGDTWRIIGGMSNFLPPDE